MVLGLLCLSVKDIVNQATSLNLVNKSTDQRMFIIFRFKSRYQKYNY